MKKLIVLFCLLAVSAIKAQAPQTLNYQGIARNSSGTIITSMIGIKFEILQGSASGTLVFDETNTILPSSAGIFTTAIGAGTPGVGSISLINWASGPYFIRVSIDPAGGTSYSTVGTSQLLSVPYALYAEKAGNTQTLTAGNGITINSGTITNASPNQTVNISGSAVTGSYPNYTITTPGAPTASTGISIVGGTVTNTAPDQTVTLTPAGISSITGTYPTFTIDVPAPLLNYNTLTNVLTLTQGTAVATTTLVGAGSSTVSMFAQGIASVTPVGAGNNFTVSVQSPSFTSIGSTSITGTYPNYVINSPGASTTIPTSLQINPPHTTTTLSANNFSITVAPTNITGAGVTGTYPNYTVTSAAQTSVASGGANVVVNGVAPSYTISAATPTIQINSPNTVTPLGLNNYSITVPQTNLTGVGVASVSGTYPNYSVTVPSPTISSTGNTITISQGTAVATATFAAGPWTTTGGVLHPAANPTNDKVAIGQNFTSSNLEIANNAGSTNTVNPVVSISNVNALFNASGVLQVRNNNGSGAVIVADNTSTSGDGIAVNLSNAANGSTALQVSNGGVGYAAYIANTNATSTSRVIDATTNGLGSVLWAVNTNSSNTSATIYGNTNGGTTMFLNNTNASGAGASISSIGTAVYGSNSGPFHTFQAQNTNATPGIFAGYFSGGINSIGKTSSNSSYSFRSQNSSLTDVLAVRDDGFVGVGTGAPNAKLDIQTTATFTNNVVNINNPNTGNANAALYMTTAGSGGGIYVVNSHTNSNAGNFYNTNVGSTSPALLVQNNGTGNGMDVFNVGGGRSISASNNATLPTVFMSNAGNGYALYAQNSSAVVSRAANIIGGLDIMGKTSGATTFPLVITNIGSTNLFNVRDDGNVGINVSNPGYRLSVNEGSGALPAIYATQSSAAGSSNAHGIMGLTSNTNTFAAGVHGESSGSGPAVSGSKLVGSGPAGRFEINSTTNTADGLFATTFGGGAAIHAVNGPTVAGSSNAALWLEAGHLKSTQATAPTTATLTVSGGGVSSGSITLGAGSTDIKGVLQAVLTTTGQINAGNNIVARVTFNKSYTTAPVVVLTSATDPGLLHPFVSAVAPGSFTVTIKNTTPNTMGAATTFTYNLNYMVIE